MSKQKIDFINGRIDGVREISLRGDINGYDGEYIANQIRNAYDYEYEGSKRIRIVINSFGGIVSSGLEIITAMQFFKDSGGIIETVNAGVADSTAGWIFAAGTKGERKIMQFASLFTHNPMFEDGRTINDLAPGTEEYEVLKNATDQIVDIFAPITGKSESFIRELMANNTDMSADEAVHNGFADKKVLVSNAPTLKNGLSRTEIFNVTNGLVLNEIKIKKMGKLAGLLNLNAEANEAAMVSEVEKIVNAKNQAETDLVNKSADFDRVNAELTDAKAKLAELENKGIENYVDALIASDASKKDQKDNLINMAKAVGLDCFKETMPVKEVVNGAKIDAGIEEEDQGDEADKELKNAKEFKAMTLNERKALKASDHSKYQALVNAYDKNYAKLM